MPNEVKRPSVALIASNHEWVARSLDSILRPEGFEVVRAMRRREVVRQLRHITPDCFLLDIDLPDTGGIEFCRWLQASKHRDRSAPIFITGPGPAPREVRIDCLRAGAWDFVAFPIDAEELIQKLHVFLEAKQETDFLRENCLLDPITGLYNARGLLRRAQEVGAASAREARPLACVAIAPARSVVQADEVSDALDRHALGRLVNVLDENTRSSDAVGRIGSLEFLVLAPDTGEPGAVRLAERLTRALEPPIARSMASRAALQAGCYAVQNFQRAAIEPEEVLVRATLALRRAQAEPWGEPIRVFTLNGSR